MARFVNLSETERHVIAALTGHHRVARAGESLVAEGSKPTCAYLLVAGSAVRYRYLPDGRRQIFGYLLPGDLCDTQFVIIDEADHSIDLLSDATVAVISLPALMTAMVNNAQIERALLMMSLVDAAMMREWLINIGQRNASQRMAHFFCELAARLDGMNGSARPSPRSIPLTQIDLADTMGLTVVHVNRVLQQFRRTG